jgi:cystathionine beta-lyase
MCYGCFKEKNGNRAFGYEIIPDSWYEAYQGWWKRQHDFSMEKDWLIFCTGVVPAISCAVKRMTNTGDHIVVQTPAYDIFSIPLKIMDVTY